MPRPTSKTELLAQARDRYEALRTQIADLSDEEMIAGGIVGEWSVKDTLAHLTAWQEMTRSWVEAGMRGETPATPSEHHTWRQIPALNQEIYEAHRDDPLEDVRRSLGASHRRTLSLIESISDDDLFTRNVYAWTKSTTLGSYLTSATSSHYEWARKEIRRGLRRR